MTSRRRKILVTCLAVSAVFLAVVLVGPRVPFDDTIRPAQLPDHLDGYLAESEGRFSDLTPDTEKMILWANEAHEATALSIVYLHGFSAIRQETAPLCEHLARRIGASVFQTRLTGHGRPGTALGDATANDWLNDAHEAFEIGCRIGRKVILLGVSTGGTLAVWLDLQADRKRIEALVLVSPNFRLKDKRAEMVTGPWGGSRSHWLWPDPRSPGSCATNGTDATGPRATRRERYCP